MFIKFDDLDMLDFFENEPISIGEFDNVLEIRKSGDVLLVEMESKKRLVLKKYACLGVIIENV